VRSAVFARKTPLTYPSYSSASVAVDAYQASANEEPSVEFNEVGPGYFGTLGIPLVSGREFGREDNEESPLVAVVNETMAVKYWAGRDPVGTRLAANGRWMRVVGVARTSRYQSLTEPPAPFFYVPLRQNFSIEADLNLRASLGAEAMANVLAREVHALDPGLTSYAVITMQEEVDRATAVQRAAAVMIGALAVLAMALAATGLYSVMSCVVSQRKSELGLRMALGAGPGRVLRLVISDGLVPTAGGLALGATAALGSTRLLGYLLYEVSPRDPLVFGLASGVMVIISWIACLIPAWRASRIDPVRALRD
jgi:predicted permease